MSFSFGYNTSTAISFHRVFMVYIVDFIDNVRTRNDEYANSVKLRKSTKRTSPVSSLKISISIVVYKDSERWVLMRLALGPPGMEPEVTLIVVTLDRHR